MEWVAWLQKTNGKIMLTDVKEKCTFACLYGMDFLKVTSFK